MAYMLVETTFVGLKAFLAVQTGTESLKVFERDGMKFFIIFHDVTKVGCVGIWRTTTRRWKIKNLFVVPEERHRGLGAAVVFVLFDLIRNIDRNAIIGVTALTEQARWFWAKLFGVDPAKEFSLPVVNAVKLPGRQTARAAFPSLWG